MPSSFHSSESPGNLKYNFSIASMFFSLNYINKSECNTSSVAFNVVMVIGISVNKSDNLRADWKNNNKLHIQNSSRVFWNVNKKGV
jgi:hypothetical protein